MNEDRLTDLETKFSHQDVAIEELQKTVHAQYLMIEKLEKSLLTITERLKKISADENPIGPANVKPPHY